MYHADDGVDEVGEEASDSDDEQHGQGTDSRKRGTVRVQFNDDVEEELVESPSRAFQQKIKAYKFTEKKLALKSRQSLPIAAGHSTVDDTSYKDRS